MIDFRYHVVSLVALFLALAGGIALGAGPLQDPVRGELSTATNDSGSDQALQEELDRVERLNEFRARYDEATAGLVLGDRLAGTSVSMLVLPGADPTVVKELGADLETAGAGLASTVTLTDALVDPAKRQLAESLVQGVLDGVGDIEDTEGASGYDLVGGALGRAFLTRSGQPVAPDGSSTSIRAAFEEAGFLAVDGAVEQRAQLALVVAGDPPDDAPEGQDLVVADLLTGLDRTDIGTVLIGSTSIDTDVPASRSPSTRLAVPSS